jgi:hypothetical protein
VAHHHASPVSPPPNNNNNNPKRNQTTIFSPPLPLVPLGGGSSYTHTQSLVVDFLSYLDRKELPPFVCVRENVHSTPIIKDFNPEGQLYRNMCVQQQFRVCVIWWTRAQHPEGDDDYSKKGGKLLRLFLFLFYPQGVNFIIQLFTED